MPRPVVPWTPPGVVVPPGIIRFGIGAGREQRDAGASWEHAALCQRFICTLLRLSVEVRLFSLSRAPAPLGLTLLSGIPQPSFYSYFLQAPAPCQQEGEESRSSPAQGHEPLRSTWSSGWPLPDMGFGAIPSILEVQSPRECRAMCLLPPAFPTLPLLIIFRALAMNCLTSFLRG